MPSYKYVTCEWCKHSVKRHVRGTRDAGKFCSRECSYASSTNMRLERQALQRLIKKQRKRAAKAAKEVRITQARLDKLKYIEQALNCVCKNCKVLFKQKTHLGGKSVYCQHCAKEMVKKHRGKSSRIAKSRRRARIRNTKNDPIDPFDVFTAAEWSCYLCGKSTPKSLRGTYDNRAPELDHIIPLSKGGTHTMDNVACACRKCNQIKGDILPNAPRRGNSSAGSLK